jgi:hypothetical protein
MAINPKRNPANLPLPGLPWTESLEPGASSVRPSGATPYRLITVRLMRPLIVQYHDLVRDLERDGYTTSVTELLHALMHAGPATKAQARALLRDWRRELERNADSDRSGRRTG